MPALAEGASIGFARTLDAAQECRVKRIAFSRVVAFAGTHALLFFAGGLLGHGGELWQATAVSE
jgi:hypothetical protein